MDRGIKISEDPGILHSVIADEGRTLMAAWEYKISAAVRDCLENFDPEPLFVPDSKNKCAYILEENQDSYPELAPFFNHVSVLVDHHSKVTGLDIIKPLIQIFKVDRVDDAYELHRDPGMGDLKHRILGVSIFTSHGAEGGNLEYLDGPDAQEFSMSSPEQVNLLICTDESRLKKLPLNAHALFIADAEEGWAHRGKMQVAKPVPQHSGYRYRVHTYPDPFALIELLEI